MSLRYLHLMKTSLALLALVVSGLWLNRLPQPPPPAILPLPKLPVIAAFEVNGAPPMSVLTDSHGAPLQVAIQLHSSTGDTLVASFTHTVPAESRAAFTLRNDDASNETTPSRSP